MRKARKITEPTGFVHRVTAPIRYFGSRVRVSNSAMPFQLGARLFFAGASTTYDKTDRMRHETEDTNEQPITVPY